MNKKEFINAVAAACGQSIEETSLVMEAVQHVIKESLQKGEPIAIPGFGSFSVKERPGRMGAILVRAPKLRSPPRRS